MGRYSRVTKQDLQQKFVFTHVNNIFTDVNEIGYNFYK